MTRQINGMDELVGMVGSEIGVSPWHEVSQSQISQFADCTGDRQWIHSDPKRARTGPFGGVIAHGYLTLSMLPYLGQQVFQLTGLQMAVNYGLNRVRFPNPVPVGSRIRDRITLLSLTTSDQGKKAVFLHEIELEGAQSPACVAETVSVLVELPAIWKGES